MVNTINMDHRPCFCEPAQFMPDENQWEPSIECDNCIEDRLLNEEIMSHTIFPVFQTFGMLGLRYDLEYEQAINLVNDDLPF